jgi:hypothetical protein
MTAACQGIVCVRRGQQSSRNLLVEQGSVPVLPAPDFHELIVASGKPSGPEKFFQQEDKTGNPGIDPEEATAKRLNIWKFRRGD